MRYKLIVSYDGTDFLGFQIQPTGRTVQGEIERAIYLLCGQEIRVTPSGRTDTGVHAQGQVISFDLDTKIEEKRLYKAINAHLPPDIRVLSCEIAPENFNARKSAKRKTYEYSWYLSDVEIPIKERYALRVDKIDLDKVKSASKLFLGEHDFLAFSSTGSSVNSTIRRIYSIKVEKRGLDVKISITGNGFLYNMVRIICGTLLEIGCGKRTEQDVLSAFFTKNRKFAGKTLSAKGLCLKQVKY